MTLRTQARKIVAAIALSVAACGASAASIEVGDSLNLRTGSGGVFGPSYLSSYVSFQVGVQSLGGSAGVLDLEGAHVGQTDWQRILAFCLEPGSSFGVDNPFLVVSDISTDVKRMWAKHFGGVDTDVEAAAFQVAIWELMLDEDPNLGEGQFRLNESEDVRSQANVYLDYTEWDKGTANLVRLRDAVNNTEAQDLVIDVPTPTSLALFALGLLGLGTIRRRTGKI